MCVPRSSKPCLCPQLASRSKCCLNYHPFCASNRPRGCIVYARMLSPLCTKFLRSYPSAKENGGTNSDTLILPPESALTPAFPHHALCRQAPTIPHSCAPPSQAYANKQRAKDEAREVQEAAQDAAIEQAQVEARAVEDAEAAKWMGLISTEGEGAAESELAEENQVRDVMT